MKNSRLIARILGPAMIALGISEAINLNVFAGISGAVV
jgi:hypothetical protein